MERDKLERIAMQALLPGLEFGLESSLGLLNSARQVLGMEALVVSVGDVPAPAKRRGRPPKTKVMSLTRADKVSASTKERWRVVKAAGLDTKGKLPTRRMVEEAKRLLGTKAANA